MEQDSFVEGSDDLEILFSEDYMAQEFEKNFE